jgi:hypothetical protein
LCGASLLGPLGSTTQAGAWTRKRTFSNSNVEDNLAHRDKNFQTESILSVIGDGPLLDNRT